MTLRNLSVFLVAILTVLFAAGCELDSDKNTTDVKNDTNTLPGATFTFTAAGISPTQVTISTGGTVTFENNDNGGHQIDYNDGTMTDGPEIPAGGSWTATFNTPGTYTFICLFHDLEAGTIIVQ